MIMDLIGNLCHLAHRHKWDVDLMVLNALATFWEEMAEEADDFNLDANGVATFKEEMAEEAVDLREFPRCGGV